MLTPSLTTESKQSRKYLLEVSMVLFELLLVLSEFSILRLVLCSSSLVDLLILLLLNLLLQIINLKNQVLVVLMSVNQQP